MKVNYGMNPNHAKEQDSPSHSRNEDDLSTVTNELIKEINERRFQTEGFADDLATILREVFAQTNSQANHKNRILKAIMNLW